MGIGSGPLGLENCFHLSGSVGVARGGFVHWFHRSLEAGFS